MQENDVRDVSRKKEKPTTATKKNKEQQINAKQNGNVNIFS